MTDIQKDNSSDNFANLYSFTQQRGETVSKSKQQFT